jgi:hypothetical protein
MKYISLFLACYSAYIYHILWNMLLAKDVLMSDSQNCSRHWNKITILVICAIMCITLLLWLWYDYKIAKPYKESNQIMSNIIDNIDSLKYEYPPDITHEEWNVAVYYTHQLAGGSLLALHANLNDLRRFQRELDERVKGKVDMNLIFWIWDEIPKLTLHGKIYKQEHQKFMLDEMQKASEGKSETGRNGGNTPGESGRGNQGGNQGTRTDIGKIGKTL